MRYKNIHTGTVVTTRSTHITKSNSAGTFLYPYLQLLDKHNQPIGVIPFTQLQTYYKPI